VLDSLRHSLPWLGCTASGTALYVSCTSGQPICTSAAVTIMHAVGRGALTWCHCRVQPLGGVALANGLRMAMEKAVESNHTEFVAQAVVTAFADTSDKGTQMGIYSAAFNSSATGGGPCSSLVAVLTRTCFLDMAAVWGNLHCDALLCAPQVVEVVATHIEGGCTSQ
jgi:hypothetical protein